MDSSLAMVGQLLNIRNILLDVIHYVAAILSRGSFHKQLLELFMPKVIDYISHVEMEVTVHLNHDLATEKWEPGGYAIVVLF